MAHADAAQQGHCGGDYEGDSKFRSETILSILNMRNKAELDFIRDDLSFMDGIAQISPRVSGVWEMLKFTT